MDRLLMCQKCNCTTYKKGEPMALHCVDYFMLFSPGTKSKEPSTPKAFLRG